MGFFGRQKIQGDELLNYLDYIGEEWKIKAFQEKEAGIYTVALDSYNPRGSKDLESLERLLDAANRLALSAAEILRRKDEISSVPDKATSLFFAWHAAYVDYLAWAVAQAEGMEDRIDGKVPDAGIIKELQVKSEKTRFEAEEEEKKLLKLLGFTDADMQQLMDRVQQAIDNDRWQPRPLSSRTKRG
ncbi:hypothetical protein Dehly_0661 [Dehalogenimonas lykanthroporepellens BL-DC-9]|jgi:hypothetical protein|nr:hypothetical protein Dehly_0661 [Dehalogenimonas lykanthroporepellens BL-DC-9]